MNVATVRRPMGCLKAALRRERWQRASTKSLATAAAADASPPPRGVFTCRQRSWKEKVAKFEIWPQVPSVRATHPDPLPALRQRQISELDPKGTRTRLFSREHADSAKVGDVFMVTTQTGEPFAGVFLQIRRRGVDTVIQLRGQLMRTGVELWFKIYSPTVRGIDIIWRRPRRARRARLTYMRKPKHDKGSVENLVMAWKKERYALSTKAKARASQPAGKHRGR